MIRPYVSRPRSASLLAGLLLATGACVTAPQAGDAGSFKIGSNDAGPTDAGPLDAGSPGDAGQDAGTPILTETVLTLAVALGVAATPDGGLPDGGTLASTLTITARDGVVPVVTDLWLYALDGSNQQTPITAFTSTAARKTPRLMLPATIGGQPSGLVPADNGNLNGLMTNTTRGTLDQGAFVSTVNGTVVVTLPTAPTTAILVVAGVEDQRYAGAAVINQDGSRGAVPTGVGLPETHPRRSFTRDIAPMLQVNCGACHNPTGADNANFYLVTGSREDLVNDNFALKEQTQDCQLANPDGGLPLTECIQAINKAQFLVEPGAPAVSDLLQRSRPDEDGGTSILGLAWYGSHGARYNATYGDRRMPSTTQSTNPSDWTNASTYFDEHPADFQALYDWVAQGAAP